MPKEKGLYKLKIDRDFKRLIPPLSVDERKQLEENLIQDGCRDALIVWDDILIDGHNRYEVCTRNEIPFSIENIQLSSREEAVAWICANQLGRRNISDETRRYLIGKRHDMEKLIGVYKNASGVNQHTRNEVWTQNDTKPTFDESATRTRERLGREYNVAPSSVQRFSLYAQAVDIIAKEAPEFHEKIISGQLKVTQESVVKIARLSPPEIQRIGEELMENPNAYMVYTNERGKMRKNTPNSIQLAQMNIGAIKEMPEYDPDAEILSLAFTVPSWISSINRVRASAKFPEISDKAREKIKVALDELKVAIDTIIHAIKESK